MKKLLQYIVKLTYTVIMPIASLYLLYQVSSAEESTLSSVIIVYMIFFLVIINYIVFFTYMQHTHILPSVKLNVLPQFAVGFEFKKGHTYKNELSFLVILPFINLIFTKSKR